MALIISDQFIKATHKTEEELRLDLAIYFYSEMKMSMGKCAQFAAISRFAFQDELAHRNLTINYEEDAVLNDMENLKKLGWL
jgi:predicted HTH domain antitoxin